MKQIVLFAFLFFASVLSVSAQSDTDPDQKPRLFQWGLKAGGDMTTLKHVNVANSLSFLSDKDFGYIGGFWGRVGTSAIYVQPELYATSKSLIIHNATAVTVNGAYLGYNTESNNATFTSIDIPVLIGTRFGLNGTITPHIVTGPVLSLNFSDKQTAGTNRVTTSTSTQDIAHVDYKGVNYGWQFGAGVDVWRFSLDFRYEPYFNKFDTYNGNQLKFNEYSISLAFRFSSLYKE